MPNNASFTSLTEFETCEHMYRLKRVDRIPEPERVPPPGKAEHPLERGIRVHNEGEEFVKSERDTLPPEYAKFEPEMHKARELVRSKKALAEELWSFTKEWQPLPLGSWGFWYVKMDLCFEVEGKSHMGGVDYKTGKSRYNQLKHASQLMLQGIAMFMRMPEADLATGENWYLDEGKISDSTQLTRRAAVLLARNWSARAERMTTAVIFQPKPSAQNCRFCPYGSNNGNSHCEHDAYLHGNVR